MQMFLPVEGLTCWTANRDLVATQGIRELKPARCAASGMDILVSGTSRDVKRPDVARVADISACVLAERLCGCWGQKEVVTNGWPRRGKCVLLNRRVGPVETLLGGS
jgi:hypothetical protein